MTAPLFRNAALLLACVVASSASAHAQNVDFYPIISTETQLQFQYDHIRSSDGTTLKRLNFNGAHQTIVDFNPFLSFNSLITMEQVRDPMPGTSTSIFSGEGAYAEEAYMRWSDQVTGVKLGKFTQNFGRAWYMTPGIYGADFVSDYQLSEKWGAELSYAFGLYKFGRHQVSISDFMADRTFLSESLFTNRGHLSLNDGGPTNTVAPNSYVATYDATNVVLPWGTLSYQLSAATLGRGEGDTGTEQRLGAGFNLNLPIRNGVAETLRGGFTKINLMGEAVRRWNADGIAGRNIDYLTGSAELVYGPWFFDLSATDRNTALAGDTTKDRLWQAAIGYNFLADTSLSFGVARKDEGGAMSTIFGTQLTYTLTSCDRCQILAKKH